VTKQTCALLLLLLPIILHSAEFQLQSFGIPDPQHENTAAWVRKNVVHSKQRSSFPADNERFQLQNTQTRFPRRPAHAHNALRSNARSGVEIDSILVYSGKDTILQIAHIADDSYLDVIQRISGGIPIDSQRCTNQWKTDVSGQILSQEILIELWDGNRWVPDTRSIEHNSYEPGFVYTEFVSMRYCSDGSSVEYHWTRADLQVFDRFGNKVSSIYYWFEPDRRSFVEFDTLYARRMYSDDSSSCIVIPDSTVTFTISDIDHPIKNKKGLLDIVAQQQRHLRSRAIISRSSNERTWTERTYDMIDGEWRFIRSFSVVDSSESLSLLYDQYYQDDTLCSYRSIIESTPTFWKSTYAVLMNDEWVNRTRVTTHFYRKDLLYFDTLVSAEEWKDGGWHLRSMKRSALDDLGNVQQSSWSCWNDHKWVPSEGSIYLYSLDHRFAWYFFGNTVVIRRSMGRIAGAAEDPPPVLQEFSLRQNYPNPFNPSTTIGFTLQHSAPTTLKIYNTVGQEVATLVNEVLEAGVYHQSVFYAHGLASGVYVARLVSGDQVQMKKIILMK